MTKQQKYTAHCVQCGDEIRGSVDLGETQIAVCHKAECPNFGVLQISAEKMKAFVESVKEDDEPKKEKKTK